MKNIKFSKPNISLMHLKLFDQNGKNLEFKKKGLAIALHILIDKNFDGFYEKLIQLDFQHNCLINLYGISLAIAVTIILSYGACSSQPL